MFSHGHTPLDTLIIYKFIDYHSVCADTKPRMQLLEDKCVSHAYFTL